MFVAVEDVVDEAVDDAGLADSLVSQEDDLVFEEGRDGALRKVQITYVRHYIFQTTSLPTDTTPPILPPSLILEGN